MLVEPHKGFILLINGYYIFHICYKNYKSNIYLDERFMLCIYNCDTFYIPYKKHKSSLQNLPWYSTIAKAFAEENLYFL